MLDARAQFAHFLALPGEIRHELAVLEQVHWQLVLGGLVGSAGDDGGLGLQPRGLHHGGAAGCLSEHHVSVSHRFLGTVTHQNAVAQFCVDFVCEVLGETLVQTVCVALLELVHAVGCLCHGGGDSSSPDVGHTSVLLRGEVLHSHSSSGAGAQVSQVTVLLEDTQGRAVDCIAHDKDTGANRQTTALITIEGHVGKLHGPGGGAFDIASFDVAVPRSNFLLLM